MTSIIALMSLVLLSALARRSTVVTTSTELRAAANYATSREAMYAAEGALEIAARELLAVADWNALLSSGALSSFVDGAPAGPGSSATGPASISLRRRPPRTASRGRGAPTIPRGACLHTGGSARGRTSSHGLATIPPRTTEIPRSMAGVSQTPAPESWRFAPKHSASGGAHKVLEATVRRDIGGGGVPDHPHAVVAGNQVVKNRREAADK